MKPLRITNIQRGCVYDGPGVRTTVFLKGCSLRCPWCCNPETQSFEEEYFINDERCFYLQGGKSELCRSCVRLSGTIPVEECPFGVAEKASVDYNIDSLLQLLLRDEALYNESKGGVTISGGEPLFYAEELIILLKQLKGRGINVAIETSLVAPKSFLEMLVGYINYFIVDLKLQPQMKLNDSAYVQSINSMISLLDYEHCIFRVVFVNQMIEEKDLVLKRLQQFRIGKLELLLCHNLALKKYYKLSHANTDYTANKESARIFADFLKDNNIDVSILSV